MKVEIKRKEWLRGEGSSSSVLLRESDSKKCCLGFRCLALGLKSPDITGVGEPYEIRHLLRKNDWMLARQFNSIDAAQAIEINDDPSMDEAERERRIAEIFARHGNDVVFV